MLKYGKRLTKPYVQLLKSGYRGVRRSAREGLPPWLSARADRAFEHVDLTLIDHGIFRLIYSNRHLVAPRVWRSSQPAPHEIALFAQRGIRTVVNLRGDRDCGSYRLEMDACRRHGIRLIDFKARSRAAPEPAFFHDAKSLFHTVDYPIVMHCKSGADRVGLMSTLYLLLIEGRPAEEAVRQLSLRYGHIRQAGTGVLDAVFDAYIAHNRKAPMPFLDWVDTHYDPCEIASRFASRSWSNFLVDRILQRE